MTKKTSVREMVYKYFCLHPRNKNNVLQIPPQIFCLRGEEKGQPTSLHFLQNDDVCLFAIIAALSHRQRFAKKIKK